MTKRQRPEVYRIEELPEDIWQSILKGPYTGDKAYSGEKGGGGIPLDGCDIAKAESGNGGGGRIPVVMGSRRRPR